MFPHKAGQGLIVPESDFSQCKVGTNKDGSGVTLSPFMRNVKSEYRCILILIYLFIYFWGWGGE